MITQQLIERIFDALRARFTYKEIEELLVTDPNTLITLVREYCTEEFEAILLPEIEAVALSSGNPGVIIELLPRGAILAPYAWSIAAPFTARYISEYAGRHIREITENTVKGVTQTIQRAEQRGVNPRVAAREFRANLGLTATQEQAISNYRDGLMNLDRFTLERKLRDKRFDPTVFRAIESGDSLSAEQIDKLVDRYRQRYHKYRAEVISRTEQMTAVSVGQRQSMLQAKEQGKLSPRLRRDWLYRHDGRARHWHRTVPSLNPDGIKIDEKYLTQPPGRVEYLEMPRDPEGSSNNVIQCRCREVFKMI